MRSRLVLVLLCGLWSRPSAAQQDDSALSLACPVCHGSAAAPAQMASFHGQSSAQIARSLRAYRDGTRAGTAMPRLASALSDAEIDALARRWGGGGVEP